MHLETWQEAAEATHLPAQRTRYLHAELGATPCVVSKVDQHQLAGVQLGRLAGVVDAHAQNALGFFDQLHCTGVVCAAVEMILLAIAGLVEVELLTCQLTLNVDGRVVERQQTRSQDSKGDILEGGKPIPLVRQHTEAAHSRRIAQRQRCGHWSDLHSGPRFVNAPRLSAG